jgi:hypothetical protein
MLSPLVYTGNMSASESDAPLGWFGNLQTGTNAVPAQEVSDLHINSDVDSSAISQHHTLGVLPTQAAAGNHTHDGKNSKRIKFSDIEGGWMNIDGGIPSTIYTPIPVLDGGGI